jgi:hypothetical protein
MQVAIQAGDYEWLASVGGVRAAATHMTEASPASTDDGFEAAVHAADRAIRDQNKRARESELARRRKLRKPKADDFPFHSSVDVLNAALSAVSALTGEPSPAFDGKSDPHLVFDWVRSQVHDFGCRCREEGRQSERVDAEPKLAPDVALQALTLMTKLDALLTMPT